MTDTLRAHWAAAKRAARAKRTLTPDEEYEWKERVAICMEGGDVSREMAEEIAWRQIEGKG